MLHCGDYPVDDALVIQTRNNGESSLGTKSNTRFYNGNEMKGENRPLV